MVLNLVLIGLAIALDPRPLTAFIVVLPSKPGVRKGAAFVFRRAAHMVVPQVSGYDGSHRATISASPAEPGDATGG